MPAHAFAESQYFGRIDAAASSSEDKDANPPLRRRGPFVAGDVLQIKHAPRGHGGRSTCHTAAPPSVAGNRDGGSHEG